MDISNIDDIKELKAMAYDELLKQESAQNNLRLINQRIQQLQSVELKEPEEKVD